MNPSIKQIWINALRSGKYEQGQGSLNEDGKFCCLGVLTDLYIRETNQEWEEYASNAFESELAFDNNPMYLCHSVQEWAGLNTPTPSAAGQPLAIWNDEGASFEEIASLIEEHL